MICYHFVPGHAIKKIKKDGYLRAQTRLFLMSDIRRLYKEHKIKRKDYEDLKNFANKLPRTKFIVAIPKNRFQDWLTSGLMSDIEYFIKPDCLLEFEAPIGCLVYTREHMYQSPRNIKSKYNKKMYKDIPEPHKTAVWIKYFKSTKRINSELDLKKIKVPELWIGGRVFLSKIKIRKLSSKRHRKSFDC